MAPESAFQSYLAGAFETFGIEVDDAELAVMAGVWQIYGDGIESLGAVDLSEVEPERAPDLSAAPKR